MTPRGRLWVRSGLIWLLLGMAAGIQIGIAGEFGAASHHAHMGLLGGLWSVAFGLLYDRSLPSLVAVSVVGQLLSLPLFFVGRTASQAVP